MAKEVVEEEVQAPTLEEQIAALTAQLEAATSKAAAAEARLGVMAATGQTDAELAEEVFDRWQKLPVDGRPDIAAYTTSLMEKPPRWLAGYLDVKPEAAPVTPAEAVPAAPVPSPAPVAAAPARPVPAPAPVARPVATRPAGGAVPATSPGSATGPTMTLQALRELRAEAARSGDYSAFDAVQAQIDAAIDAALNG